MIAPWEKYIEEAKKNNPDEGWAEYAAWEKWFHENDYDDVLADIGGLASARIHFKFNQALELYTEKLREINQWCEAYPLEVFPEPDLKKAARVLRDAGLTLDAISASNMRYVLEGIKRIIDEESK